jgi:hypothetical protein
MMTSQHRCLRGILASAVFVTGLVSSATADESAAVTREASTHPLSWTLRYATSRSDYIRKHIRDYSCRLIKRERIDGELQKHQFIKVQVRCEQRSDDNLVRPMAVFMQYLAPKTLKGRKVLYIDGQNDGMMEVLKGGRAFKYVKLRIDPKGNAARRESNYPITDVGFDKIIERLTQRVTDDIKNDPTAANTQVSHFRNARVNDRVCTHIRVLHPKRGNGIEFHKASLYIDDELHVPIRLVVYDWPSGEGQQPPLIEEYTYVDLRLNIGLTDADFSKTKLDSSPAPNTTRSASLSR